MVVHTVKHPIPAAPEEMEGVYADSKLDVTLASAASNILVNFVLIYLSITSMIYGMILNM